MLTPFSDKSSSLEQGMISVIKHVIVSFSIVVAPKCMPKQPISAGKGLHIDPIYK